MDYTREKYGPSPTYTTEQVGTPGLHQREEWYSLFRTYTTEQVTLDYTREKYGLIYHCMTPKSREGPLDYTTEKKGTDSPNLHHRAGRFPRITPERIGSITLLVTPHGQVILDLHQRQGPFNYS